MDSWLTTASAKSIQWNAIKVPIVVGSLLNLINQGDNLFARAWQDIHWAKLILTYCVPYCVAVYAGTQARREK